LQSRTSSKGIAKSERGDARTIQGHRRRYQRRNSREAGASSRLCSAAARFEPEQKGKTVEGGKWAGLVVHFEGINGKRINKWYSKANEHLYNIALQVNKRSVERKETNHFVTIVIVVADVAGAQEGVSCSVAVQ
jgi:hypothetical protein